MDGILDQVSLKVAYKTTFILYLLCCVATGYALFSASWLRSRVVVGNLDVRSSYGLAVYCTKYVVELYFFFCGRLTIGR